MRALRELRPAGVIAHIYSGAPADRLLALGRPLVNVSGVLTDVAPKLAAVPRVGVDDIADEIRRTHVECARGLLAGTDLPVAAVATSSDFSGNKHLSVVFRQETGVAPTAYRRQFRGAGKSERAEKHKRHRRPGGRGRPAA